MRTETTSKIYTYDEAKEKITEIFSVILEAPTKDDYSAKTKPIQNVTQKSFFAMLAFLLISALISYFVEPVYEYSICFFIGICIGVILLNLGQNLILKKKYPNWYKGYKLAYFKTQEQLCNEITNIILNTDIVNFEKQKNNTTTVLLNIGYLENPQICTANISVYEDIVDGKAVFKTKKLNFI